MALFTRFANDGNLHTFRSSDDGMSIRNCGGEDTNDGSMNPLASSTASRNTAHSGNPSKDSTNAVTMCKRCREKKAVCKVREEFLCQSCALVYISNKCRKALLDTVTIGRDILLAVGGGDASIVAMHTISSLMDCGQRRRRVLKDAAIVYVDTSSVYPDDEQRYARVTFLTRLALSLGLHIYIVPIESFFTDKLYILPLTASFIATDGTEKLPTNVSTKDEVSVDTTSITATTTTHSAPDNDATVTVTPAPSVEESISRETHRKNKKKEKKSQVTDSLLTDTLTNRISSSSIDQQIHILHNTLQSLRSSPSSSSSFSSPLSLVFTKAIDDLRTCLDHYKQTDQKQEFIDILIHHLVYRTTHALRFSCLVTCDSADRMAQRIMLNTFSGEGFSLPMDIASIDTRFYASPFSSLPFFSSSLSVNSLLPNAADNDSSIVPLRLPFNWYATTAGSEKPEPFILPDEEQQALHTVLQRSPTGPVPDERGDFLILRPFAEMEQKEFAIYRRYLRHILDITTPINAQPSSFTAAVLPRTSIANTTQGVLFGLQSSFPSTVHNVVRTVRKLRIPSFIKNSNTPSSSPYIRGLCELCYGLLPGNGKDDTQSTNVCFRCHRLQKENPYVRLPSKI